MEITQMMARAAIHWFNYFECESSPDSEDYKLRQAFMRVAYPEQWAQEEAERLVREAEAREAEAQEYEAAQAEALHHWGCASRARAARFHRITRRTI